jgi:hypothetical protein
MTKKLKENNDLTKQEQEEQKIKSILKIHDFMPGYGKEEDCFRKAIVYDFATKKFSEDGWPRDKPVSQITYENWLVKVVNKRTGEFYQKKDRQTGALVEGTGARYIINVICRVRDAKGKNEYLYSKGRLEGYNETGWPEKMSISWPEVWNKTEFNYERNYNEKTGAFIEYTTGPSGTEKVYDMPFNEQNVRKLYEQTEDGECQFVVKDLKTEEARSVQWSSVKDTLDLFIHKPFDFLFNGDYIPLPVRMEARQEAVAKGLIKGVASDFESTTTTTQPTYTL